MLTLPSPRAFRTAFFASGVVAAAIIVDSGVIATVGKTCFGVPSAFRIGAPVSSTAATFVGKSAESWMFAKALFVTVSVPPIEKNFPLQPSGQFCICSDLEEAIVV